MPCGVGGGYPPELAWWTGGLAWRGKAGWEGVREAGQGLGGGGGCKGFGSGGVGGRHGPQGRSKFRNVCRIFVVSNAYKKKKNGVF